MRYYVARGAYFDSHPYNTRAIKAAVKRGGGDNIRTSNYHGWSNQPSVVTFSVVPSKLGGIEKALEKALKTQWVRIAEKFW